VRVTGSALRADAADFLRLLEHGPGLRRLVGRYLDVRAAQLAGLAICLRFHGLDARLARWMLMSQDRVAGSSFMVTHEVLARMLGVRRAGVTRAAIALQEQGLIRYARGTVTVLDRAGMLAAACSCYALDQAQYTRLLEPSARCEAVAQA
jgi:CRP-like cAMP-binding protein